jgi:hypothetical protein
LTENEARSRMQVTANRRAEPKMMQGNIEEIPLPDLLQLLSTSRKSGVLVLRSEWGTGRLYLRKGQIYFANVDESFDVSPRKAMFRMLTWDKGLFELEPPDDRTVMEEIQDSTEGLLMEGMRQLDEFRELSAKLPPFEAIVSIPRPLEQRLRELKPQELDLMQPRSTKPRSSRSSTRARRPISIPRRPAVAARTRLPGRGRTPVTEHAVPLDDWHARAQVALRTLAPAAQRARPAARAAEWEARQVPAERRRAAVLRPDTTDTCRFQAARMPPRPMPRPRGRRGRASTTRNAATAARAS